MIKGEKDITEKSSNISGKRRRKRGSKDDESIGESECLTFFLENYCTQLLSFTFEAFYSMHRKKAYENNHGVTQD